MTEIKLTAEELAALEKFRKAQAAKVEKEAKANMPGFSFRIEMMDGESVVWSGKAADADVALQLAKEKAESENDSGILDWCKRKYMPKGRKALADAILADPRDGDNEEETDKAA